MAKTKPEKKPKGKAKPKPKKAIRHKDALTLKQYEEALRNSGGIQYLAAQALGVTRQAVNKKIATDAELQRIYIEIVEVNLDLSEDQIVKALKAGDLKTCRWYLDRKGKGRGYGQGLKLTDGEGGSLFPREPLKITEGMSAEEATKIYMESLRNV